MNTTSRVPGISRNSGWREIDAEITARRLQQLTDRNHAQQGTKPDALPPKL
jgi:hypothetical protein